MGSNCLTKEAKNKNRENNVSFVHFGRKEVVIPNQGGAKTIESREHLFQFDFEQRSLVRKLTEDMNNMHTKTYDPDTAVTIFNTGEIKMDNPIQLEIIKNALNRIGEEMAIAIIRAAPASSLPTSTSRWKPGCVTGFTISMCIRRCRRLSATVSVRQATRIRMVSRKQRRGFENPMR